jgi:hypothetical protein
VALMPIKVNAGARRQGTECPRRVRLDAGLSGGIGRVGIGEGLGLLGLLVAGIPFDDLFFLLLSTYEFWIWVLGIPKVTRSLMSLIAVIGMLAISLHLDI